MVLDESNQRGQAGLLERTRLLSQEASQLFYRGHQDRAQIQNKVRLSNEAKRLEDGGSGDFVFQAVKEEWENDRQLRLQVVTKERKQQPH